VAESGYPGFEAEVWIVLMVPARTPEEVVRRLNQELVRVIRDPALKASLWDRQWIDAVASTPAEAAATIRRESEKWARIVKAAGLDLE
jgi:tripartite-type tricarboxylate transporter receptor subunit TctC